MNRFLRAFAISSHGIRIVLIIMTFVLIGLSYRFGIDRGHDGMLASVDNTWAYFRNSVCGVLSTQKYNADRYACDVRASNSMTPAGLNFQPEILGAFGKKMPDVLRDAAFINNGLQTVFSVSRLTEPGPIVGLGWGTDSGYMDFVQLAFALFGEKLDAFYYTFFLLFLISGGLFVAQFRRKLFALFVGITFYYVFYKYLSLGNLEEANIQLVTNPRFATVLAIVPVLHFGFAILHRIPPSLANVALMVPQGVLMMFVANVRLTAYWTVIAIAVFSLITVVSLLRRNRKPADEVVARCWPGGLAGVLLLMALLSQSIATETRLASEGWTRNHNFWHAMNHSLQFHPGWKDKYFEKYGRTTDDEPPMIALKAYMERNNLNKETSKESFKQDGGMKHEYIEKYLRTVFFEFFLDDPVFVLENFIYYNGKRLLGVAFNFVDRVFHNLDLWFVVLFLFAGSTAIRDRSRTRGKERFAVLSWGVGMVLLFAILSAAPNWATLVLGNSLGDPTLMIAIASLAVAFWVFVALGITGTGAFRDWSQRTP